MYQSLVDRANPNCVPVMTLCGIVLCIAVGCQSGPKWPIGSQAAQCEGGACSMESDSPEHKLVSEEQSQAELFAAMNYKTYAKRHDEEARVAKAEAAAPKGPDSLFASFRE